MPLTIPQSLPAFADQQPTGSRVEARTSVAAAGKKPADPPQDLVDLSKEAQEIEKLAKRDREVKLHEAAHAAVGGNLAGAPSYTYKTGPDGKRYAVAGEVSISVRSVPGDPQATLAKAEQVRAAALAPAEPSSADLRVAAKAAAMAAKARTDMAQKPTASHFSTYA